MTDARPGWLRALGALAGLLMLTGCAVQEFETPATGSVGTVAGDGSVLFPIFAADDALENDWSKFQVWRDTEFRLAALDDAIVIRAVAEGSSAMLARRIEIDTEICPVVEWSWRIEGLPETADLASRDAEDMAASIFFAFGDPGVFSNPDPVPTLRYVWATETDPVDRIVDSPYFPGIIRSVVVRSGPERVGEWVTERRDLVADYASAFGGQPEGKVEIVALFTDSDHGKDRIEAFYAWARARCTEEPGFSIFD